MVRQRKKISKEAAPAEEPLYRITREFTYGSGKELIGFATNIKNNMKGNVSFPDMPVTEKQMEDAVNNYTTSYNNVIKTRSGGNTDIDETDRLVLTGLLTTLADWAEGAAPSEKAIIDLGFILALKRQKITPKPENAPEGVTASMSEFPNAVWLSCKPVKIANSTGRVQIDKVEEIVKKRVDMQQLLTGC